MIPDGYGGVAIFCKRQLLSVLTYSFQHLECLVVVRVYFQSCPVYGIVLRKDTLKQFSVRAIEM